MALAPALPPANLARPTRRPDAERGARRLQPLENSWAEQAFAPAGILVSAVVEASAADLGWLAWLDRHDPVVVRREALSPVEPSLIAEFPDPPEEPIIIDAGAPLGPWALWCRARGIQSCVVVPVVARARVIGTMGLVSSTASALGRDDARKLAMVSSLAVQARTYEARLAGQRPLFAVVSRSLVNALSLDRPVRQPPTYQEIARAVGDSVDASYCLIAIHDSKGALSIRARAGHRPPRRIGAATWRVSGLRGCARALRERHAVVLTFSQHDPAIAAERRALFTSTTQVGAILPFFVGPRTEGVLIVGGGRPVGRWMARARSLMASGILSAASVRWRRHAAMPKPCCDPRTAVSSGPRSATT